MLSSVLAASRAADAVPSALLVSGDAGIGKTTLVGSLSGRAQTIGFVVAQGHCVDVTGGMPLRPVIEAARTLGPVDGSETWLSRGGVEAALDAVVSLVAGRPTVLVLEDMHWADRYTAEFASAFVRTARAPVVLVVTFRSEDLAVGHPFRESLVNLRRADNVTAVPLGPLGEEALVALAARRTGRTLQDQEVRTMLDRCEGNPLFAEELLDAQSEALSPSLLDLLARHLRGMSPATVELVRTASASNSVVAVQELAHVTGLDQAAVEAALREALDRNVLVRRSGSLIFRHALLREAVYEDLLPGERRRLHARYVTALDQHLTSAVSPIDRWQVGADLAYHATAAGDLGRALEALVAAAQAAHQFGAEYEAADLYEQAFDLWDRVPDASSRMSLAQTDLARLAALTVFPGGEEAHIADLLRRALALVDPVNDPQAASRVYATVAGLPFIPDEVITREEALSKAMALVGDHPTGDLAEALRSASRFDMWQEQWGSALDNARRAQDAAAQVGYDSEAAQSLYCERVALFYLGRCPEALAAGRRLATIAPSMVDTGLALESAGYDAWFLAMMGRHDEGLALARRARSAAVAAGLPAVAAVCGEPEVTSLVLAGRLSEAASTLADVSPKGMVDYLYRWMACDVALARGDLQEARRNADRSFEEGGDVTLEEVQVHHFDLCAAEGDVNELIRRASRFADGVAATDSPLMASISAYMVMRAVNASGTGSEDLLALADLGRSALDFARRALSPSWEVTWHASHLSFAQAYEARLDGRAAHEEWAEAVDRAARIGAYVALLPRLELAVENLTRGSRTAGKEQLVSLWTDVRAMGAGWYEREAAALATRHRVPLPGRDEEAGPLARLTPREREVLNLLASGATNRQIAGTLVISERTAGLHVGNILAKLDLPNRGAAAALARELGLSRP